MSAYGCSDQLPRPVFLVGPAHTGKTELGAALREDLGAVVVRGAYFWRTYYGRFGTLTKEANLLECTRHLASDEYLLKAGLDQDRLIALARTTNQTYGDLFLRTTYEAACRLENPQSSPPALVVQVGGLETMAQTVGREVDNAAFFHTIRDPRRYFGLGGEHHRTGRLGWRLASWSASAESAIRNREKLASRYLVVRGEDMIESSGQVASQISQALSKRLTLNDAGRSLSVKGEPLSLRRARVVERLVGRQLEALGYPIEGSARSVSPPRVALEAGAYHIRSRLVTRAGGCS